MDRRLLSVVALSASVAPFSQCHGNAADHCCYIAGKVCDYLEENTIKGRRWVCGLLRRFGSWEAMNDSPEYQPIGAYWATISKPFNYCQTFDPGFCCRPDLRFGRLNEHELPDPVLIP